jgi:RNA polymerase sigma-70 factor (ECF subfamily)
MAQEPFTKTLELVRKAQDGDRTALNRLFERYYERVRRAVRARIGQQLRRRLETGDILQQTFAKAFEKFSAFEMRDEGSLVHWLSMIADRQIRDEADRAVARKRRPPKPLVELDAPAGDQASGDLAQAVPGAHPAPPGMAQTAEEIAALDECLDALPAQYRELLILRDFEGLEWDDAAEAAGRPSASAAREMHTKATLELAKLLRSRGIGRRDS